MPLSLQEVEHIATLARLELSQAEKDLYRAQLSEILEYAARLQTLDTSEIPPTSSVLPPRSALRDDEAHPGLPLDALLRNAPDTDNDQFRVPAVFD